MTPGTTADLNEIAQQALALAGSRSAAPCEVTDTSEREAVVGRLSAARGALLGILLGAVMWAALLLAVLPHFSK